jgi:hypothetical protein
MITKNDCMSILIKLEDRGVNIDNYMRKLVVSKEIPLEVLKFISQHRGIEVADFYEMLRKKHNQKKSPLYLNIVKEVSTLDDVITTLVCLLTQITLYSNKLDNKDSFLKEVRAEEITRVLNEYFKEGTYDTCIALLKIIKSDLLVLEYIAGRRDLN